MSDFYNKHQDLLSRAQKACKERGYWSPYAENPSPKIYGETAQEDGEKAFEALLGKNFELKQAADDWVGAESSPYGKELGIKYPGSSVDKLIENANEAGKAWGKATPEIRAGVCLEILERINKQSFLMAHAVMHTTGQAYMMAFQAAGPHAQDRGLEAVAYAYDAMTQVPAQVRWEKPAGKDSVISLDKTFRIIPRGIALVIGCATFPTWNGYPALFASLVTGNSVITKPHPGAILPTALTVRICQDVLEEAGFSPLVVQLAADEPSNQITQELALHSEIAIIDFTGSSQFGKWLRDNATQAQLYTEEAGVNAVVISSTDNFSAMCANLAFSLSLYSGQMCTTPQNIFVPKGGIETDEGHKSFDDVASGIKQAVDGLLGKPARATALLGAIQNPATMARIEDAKSLGEVVRPSTSIEGAEGMENARIATPMIIKLDAQADQEKYLEERFGPISFIIAAEDSDDALTRAAASTKQIGAITAALYSTDEDMIEAASDAFADAGVALSVNLTGGIFVNQSAAFSDYHVSGANPAGNACLTDSAFVANRFRVAAMRRPNKAA